MLNVNSLNRPTLKQILRHPWITKEGNYDDWAYGHLVTRKTCHQPTRNQIALGQ